MERPERVQQPNLELLYAKIEEYFDHLEDEDTCEDTQGDMDHEIIETAIEVLFGKAAEKYISEKLEEIENRN